MARVSRETFDELPRPIRLLHVIGSLRIGGAEGQMVELLTHLDRERFAPRVVCLTGKGPLAGRLVREGIGIDVLGFSGRWGMDPRSAFSLLRARHRLGRIIRRAKPHIVHTQLFWAYVLANAVARRRRVPRIITSQLSIDDWMTRGAAISEAITHSSPLPCSSAAFGRALHRRLARRAFRSTHLIHTNSRAVASAVQQFLGRTRPESQDNPLIVLPNGVSIERFRPRRPEADLRRAWQIPEGAPVVGMVANLHPYKGHVDLINALGHLHSRWPALVAVIIGRDENGQAARLAELAARLGLANQIRWVGEQIEPERWYPMFDIVVSASHTEGFSNTILEAMACGRAIVATRVGGTPEAVRNGETGVLVPPGAPEALAAAIDGLLADPAARQRLGQAAHRVACEQFSLDRIVAAYENLCQKLLLTAAGQLHEALSDLAP